MQTNIFEDVENFNLTIDQAAKTANVSTATIRNWIKTGYLVTTTNGLVTQASLDNFMSEVAGIEKLNSRANKQLKDWHDHNEISNRIGLLIKKFKGETIGTEYENSLSDSYKNKEGIYYTPLSVVKDMFKGFNIKRGYTFLDPCCGSGNFILEAIRQGISPENVYGYDNDENAVLITKQRIKDEFGFETQNVKVGDFLQEAYKLNNKNISFDLIFTNPPWGKKIEKSKKEMYARLYGCGNSLDTTSLFLSASLSVLKPNGFLGFLFQEAFFNITSFEDIRRKVLGKKILRFVDYGKAFKNLLTKAQAFIIENKNIFSDYLIECSTENKVFNRSFKSFVENPKSIINFTTDEPEAQVINQLYSIKHITLKDGAIWALGIVTGNNKRFCSKEPKDGYVPIYRGSDITKSGIKEPSLFIPTDFSNFQQVAPLEMYHSKEKIIYKFISSSLCFYCDTKQRYILNSANLFVPINIGITSEQLTMLLNSEIINWLFQKLFSTHKVLRGDLELLPIHTDYYKNNKSFSEESYMNYLQIMKTSDGTYRIKK